MNEYLNNLNTPLFSLPAALSCSLNDPNPFVYCDLDSNTNECTPITSVTQERQSFYNFALQTGEEQFDAGVWHVFTVSTGTSPVKFNEDYCSVSDAVDICETKAKNICSAAFNTTNPNFRGLPPLPESMFSAVFFIFFSVSVIISLKIKGLNDDSSGMSSINRRMRHKFDQIVDSMEAKEATRAELIMGRFSLRFYEEDRELAFAKRKLYDGLYRCIIFLCSHLIFVFGLAIGSPGLPDYQGRFMVVGFVVAGVASSFARISESFPEFNDFFGAFLPTMVGGSAVWILLVIWFDDVRGE